jgi:hypothetical protein
LSQLRPLVLAKALAIRDQIEARRRVAADGLEVLLVGRPLDHDLLRYCADHFPEVTYEVGDRLSPGIPVDPLSDDPRTRSESRARIEAVFEAAQRHDASAVTVHLVAGAVAIKPGQPPPVMDRDQALAEARQYYGSLGPRLVVENILPVDFIGAGRAAHGPIGRMIDDFLAVDLPVCLDTAHLGASLLAAGQSAARGGPAGVDTPEGRFQAVFGQAERRAADRVAGLSLSRAVKAEAELLAPGRLAHVHVGNFGGFGPDCDGRVRGELDLEGVVRDLLALHPQRLIPELIEPDYVAYQRNAGLIESLKRLAAEAAPDG